MKILSQCHTREASFLIRIHWDEIYWVEKNCKMSLYNGKFMHLEISLQNFVPIRI